MIAILAVACGSERTPVADPPARPLQLIIVDITIETVTEPGGLVTVKGTTNLPEGTQLMASVQDTTRLMEGGFLGQHKCKVLKAGRFMCGTFGPPDGLAQREYEVGVTMPLIRLQSAAVKRLLGAEGEYIDGPLVKRGVLGVSASREITLRLPKGDSQ